MLKSFRIFSELGKETLDTDEIVVLSQEQKILLWVIVANLRI